ncbi:MAG: hypothetical protein KY394_03195 [Actinobacteria bacterium]|nr:hypothetical protein [Actinomycetota bacterium]
MESEGGDLGAWPLQAVKVRRLEGDTFAMTVAGEDLHFIADDTISFAYSGMPAIERVSGSSPSRSRIRDFLGRLGSGSTSSPPSSPVARVAEEDLPPAEPAVHEIVVGDPDEEVIDVNALAVEEAHRPTPIAPAPTPPPPAPFPAASEAGDDTQPSCPGVTAEGQPCRSPILASSGYCYSHDPERSVEDGYRKAQEARARLRRKGTARLTKVYSRLEAAMRQVERGELEPEVAVAMAQLARTMCAILDLDEQPPETDR